MFNSEEAKLFSVRAAEGLCSHAYIVDGEEGIGKLDFALYCARALLCTEKSKPCLTFPTFPHFPQAILLLLLLIHIWYCFVGRRRGDVAL